MEIATNIVDLDYALVVRECRDCTILLWERLQRLGYGYDECQWHCDHSGELMPQGYAVASDQ